MKFAAASAVFFSLAGLVASATIAKRNCPQAARFGALSAFPVTVSPGDSITVSVNLNCPIEQFGIIPQFLDYTIEVPEASNNGHEQPIVLARRTFNFFGIIPQFLDYTIEVPEASNNGHEQPIVLARRTFNFVPGTIQPTDEFTTQVPHAPFFAGAAYNIVLNMVYPINGTDGSTVLVEGGVSFPITINA
ncbi:hypothetical protein CVT25_001821 [Psilocybe cyanescens]|uniref:Uncharacterized protein n=1 Tax=Psilocybe cyanescens TaxID=93625 RepID=A0A409WQC1_PSICY|nr:hypothetical protein CVT25_001821 [Psilocybe cyanescens]